MKYLPLPLLLAGTLAHAQFAAPAMSPAISATQLALVVNDDEPNSVAIAEYYRQARNVPAANIIHVRIPNRPRKLGAEAFAVLKKQIDSQLKPDIQAVLMVWTAPYAVECNSITSAYTLGLDAGLCSSTCGVGQPSSYFNAVRGLPFDEYKMRLSMLLPTESVAQAKELIDRGVSAGFRLQEANAYYLQTSEMARNSRAPFFPPAGRLPSKKLNIKRLRADELDGASDIMVYQTGMARVARLETLKFAPGALADHLTSFGGDLLGTGQMSSLRWLEAGATASYGSVSEPCNYWQKFPQPTVLLQRYLSGDTAIEAYWKSVAWPAQGVFIGEPLSTPYRR